MSNFMMLEREYLTLCIIVCYFGEHSTNVTIQEREIFLFPTTTSINCVHHSYTHHKTLSLEMGRNCTCFWSKLRAL